MTEPVDQPDWTAELKLDGFRALAYVCDENRLVSRNGSKVGSLGDLADWVAAQLPAGTDAILDGEIVCVDGKGKPVFNDLLFRRGDPIFYSFDLLWLNGSELRGLPLGERKQALKQLIDSGPLGWRLVYVDDFPGRAVDLFRIVCDLDMEGVVLKDRDAPYVSDREQTTWIKVKNPNYSQAKGRHELFATMRSGK